jgi:nitrogen fixation protein NifU and related proteins
MTVDSMYQEIILDHYRNPQHKGLREPYDVEVHHVNPTCGDEVTLRLRLTDGAVEDISYDSIGCSISQASASVMSGLLRERDVDDALGVQERFLTLLQSRGTDDGRELDRLEDAVAFAGVSRYPARIKCALLPWMAWKDAVLQARDRDLTTVAEES